MSATQQAKNGLKTFILTFGVSLLVFGAFYYIISDYSSSSSIDIENSSAGIGTTQVLGDTNEVDEVTPEPQEQGSPDIVDTSTIGSETEKDSPFGQLVQQKVNAEPKTVLSSHDIGGTTTTQTTQSTVPETGTVGVTFGLVTSIALFALFAYLVFVNPRNYALSKFEDKLSR